MKFIKNYFFVILVTILIVVIATNSLVKFYKDYTGEIFTEINEENMSMYTKGQKEDLLNSIEELSAMINATDSFIQNDNINLDQSLLNEYFDSLFGDSGDARLHFYTYEEALSIIHSEEEMKVLETIRSGHRLHRQVKRIWNGKTYYFYEINHPVVVNNQNVGILYGYLNLNEFIEKNQDGFMNSDIHNYIINKDDEIMELNKKDHDIFKEILNSEETKKCLEEIKNTLANNGSGVHTIVMNDATYYLSYSPLFNNELYILDISEGKELQPYASGLSKTTLLMMITVMFELMILFVAYYFLYRDYMKRHFVDNNKFLVLMNMNESVLFEYLIDKDEMSFSRKAEDVFDFKSYNIKRWVRYNYPEHMAHPDDVDAFVALFTDFKSDGKMREKEFRLKVKDGSYRWFNVKSIIEYDEYCRPVRLTAKMTEYSNTKKEAMEFKLKSQTDKLTGLLNKEAFEKEMNIMLTKDLIDNDFQGFLLILDLDDFKHVNDTYGHQMGDEVLKAVAALLKSHFRHSDLVGRFGGDEFVMCVKSMDNVDKISEKSRNLLEDISAIRFEGYDDLVISCSIGITKVDHGESYYTLFTQSDAAMYKAKRKGKNKFEIFKK